MKARLLRIRGRVQGVGYRDWLVREASAAGLTGWVRNRADGSVEALLAGEEPAVGSVLLAARHGPPLARVEKIEESFAELPDEPGFHRRPTA
ncbi:acylphosphatase [Roseomonas sp. SSH11]|uniref:acylphosphatase n=1 Tax=Pararoseomonas baculiformis TaxID=2820812 RepID=A0ABS4AIN0_9PROT|nr:acylphosphatase [Pararoseomonas baculiformis]MBP0446879.1 acylphosphatase [Pararoseomonas baculiformis]